MNETKSYVIGFSPTNLLHIEQPYITDDVDSDWTIVISSEISSVAEATVIKGYSSVNKILKEIQNDYDFLDVFDKTPAGELRIFEVGVI